MSCVGGIGTLGYIYALVTGKGICALSVIKNGTYSYV